MLGSKQSFCHEYHHMWIYWAQHTCKTYLQIKYLGLHFAMPQYVLHVLHASSPNEISRVQPWRLWLSSMQTNRSFMQALSQVVFVRRADSDNLSFCILFPPSLDTLLIHDFSPFSSHRFPVDMAFISASSPDTGLSSHQLDTSIELAARKSAQHAIGEAIEQGSIASEGGKDMENGVDSKNSIKADRYNMERMGKTLPNPALSLFAHCLPFRKATGPQTKFPPDGYFFVRRHGHLRLGIWHLFYQPGPD